MQAPILFEACIVLLTSTMSKLHEELDRRTTGYYQVRLKLGSLTTVKFFISGLQAGPSGTMLGTWELLGEATT